MDKGAHFYKCDFQVHTPRDANWYGVEAATPSERKAYAEELVQACRTKGLAAIAITDHHDLTFFPYVKAAAAAEVDATGRPIPREQRLVVFPGLELGQRRRGRRFADRTAEWLPDMQHLKNRECESSYVEPRFV